MGKEHWINVPLGNVATYINGRAFKPMNGNQQGTQLYGYRIPFLKTTNYKYLIKFNRGEFK
jgi:hypothetical protein